MKKIRMLLWALFSCLAVSAGMAQAPRGITITAEGSHTVQADLIQFRVMINISAEKVDEAYRKYEEQEQHLIKLLKANGIGSEDIQFSPLSVFPVSRPQPDNRMEQELKQIQIRQPISLILDDFSLYSKLQRALIEGGFYDLRGSFKSTGATEAQHRALENAVETARQKAQLIARTAGLTLGPVKSVEYGTASINRAQNRVMAMEVQSADRDLISEYDQSITYNTSVTIVYETKKAGKR